MEIKEDKYRDVGWKQFFEVFDMVGFILIIFVMGIFGFLYVMEMVKMNLIVLKILENCF